MSDHRDPDIERMLGRLSGAYPDANTAYVAVAGRVRQAKRRRAFVASSAACLMLLGVGALAARGGSEPQQVQPASESGESSDPTLTSAETSVQDDSSSSSEEPTSSIDDTSTSTIDDTATSQDPIEPLTVPSVSASGTNTGGDSSTSTSTAGTGKSTSSSEATVTVPNGQTTHNSAGGSIVVALTDGALSLVSDSPIDGFTTRVKHDKADRVEVEFTNDDTTWRIRIDLVDGVPVVETSQH